MERACQGQGVSVWHVNSQRNVSGLLPAANNIVKVHLCVACSVSPTCFIDGSILYGLLLAWGSSDTT